MMQGIASLVAESMSLSFQLKSRGHPPKRTRDRFGNFATDERFAEHVADPCGLRSLAELRTAVTAHEYDRNVGVQLPDLARELGPCQVRHRLVGQYEIGALWLRAKRLQGRGTRVKPYGLIIEFRKNLFRERGHFPGERPALRRAALGKQRAPAAACSMALHVPRRVAEDLVLGPVRTELLAPEAVNRFCELIRTCARNDSFRAEPAQDPAVTAIDAEISDLESLIEARPARAATMRPLIEDLRTKQANLRRGAMRRAQSNNLENVPAVEAYRAAVADLASTLAGSNVEAARRALRGIVGTVSVFAESGKLYGRIGFNSAQLLRTSRSSRIRCDSRREDGLA
jgi:hypothetical protein